MSVKYRIAAETGIVFMDIYGRNNIFKCTGIIDLKDFKFVQQMGSWHSYSDRYKSGIYWQVRSDNGTTLGRYILGLKKGDKLQCHHIDRDSLNFRRSNLKIIIDRRRKEN